VIILGHGYVDSPYGATMLNRPIRGTDSGLPLRSLPDWLPMLAQSQGFLLDALDANRAGRYTDAQVRLLEARGRSLLGQARTSAFGPLGMGLILFLFALVAPSLRQTFPGTTIPPIGPGAGTVFTALLASLALLVAGVFVLRSAYRPWRSLRADLQQQKIVSVEGQVTLKGPPTEALDLSNSIVGQKEGRARVRGILAVFFLLADFAVSSEETPKTYVRVPFSDRFAYIVDGVSFKVDPQAWCAFQGPWTESRFRIYYVPCCNWIVNMEPIVQMSGQAQETAVEH
jgi:hypothetical protein